MNIINKIIYGNTKSDFKMASTLTVIGLICLLAIPMLIAQHPLLTREGGPIGDEFSGTTMPFLTLLAGLLTFFAFVSQVRANINQSKDLKVDRFESIFYNLIELHRKNTEDFNIQDRVKGRGCFKHMFDELHCCYKELEDACRDHSTAKPLSELQKLNIAYIAFFWGLEEAQAQSKNIFYFCDQDLLASFFNRLRIIQEKFENHKDKDKLPQHGIFKMKYKYFRGHLARLDNYYRNLFQIAKYVNKYTIPDSETEKKEATLKQYEYYRTLRSQLTCQEQLLLYYSSKSVFGEHWYKREDNGNGPSLIKKSKILRNLHLPMASFGPNPTLESEFDGGDYFEWYDVTQRLNNLPQG